MASEVSPPASEKLRTVLDYLPCEPCLAIPTEDQELLCSLCRRLDRQVAVKLVTRTRVIVERPTPAEETPLVIAPPGEVSLEAEREPEREPAGALPIKIVFRRKGLLSRAPQHAGDAIEVIVEPYDAPAHPAAATPPKAPAPPLEFVFRANFFSRLPAPLADRQVVLHPYKEASRQVWSTSPTLAEAHPAAALPEDEDEHWDDLASYTDDGDLFGVAGASTAAAARPRPAPPQAPPAAPEPLDVPEPADVPEDDFVFRPPAVEDELEPPAPLPEIEDDWMPDEEIALEPPAEERDPWAPPQEEPATEPEEEILEMELVEDEPEEEILEMELVEDDPTPATAAPAEPMMEGPPETPQEPEPEPAIQQQAEPEAEPIAAAPEPEQEPEFQPEPEAEPIAAAPEPEQEPEFQATPEPPTPPAAAEEAPPAEPDAPTPDSDLWRLPRFDDHARGKLQENRIDAISHLNGHDATELSQRTGIPADTLATWLHIAELTTDIGIPIDASISLVTAGIHTPQQLADTDAEEIVARVEASAAKTPVTTREIKRWKRRA